MKKLDWLIIKSFLGPLLLTFSISEFVLLLQFLWKLLEKLIGKGLETVVILQLFWYILVTLVPMALPLAILLASIMVLGNFGEKYELVAMKSAGLSLWRILRPLIVIVSLLSVFAFFFNNNFMPIAQNRMRTLLYEINTTKPSINIKPNIYYTDIDNYVIKIGSKAENQSDMTDIIIYDHSQKKGNTTITYAKTGTMTSEDNGNTLVFVLFNGYSYDENSNIGSYKDNPLLRINFQRQIIRFDISDFAFEKSDEDRYSNHYKMMGLTKLRENVVTLKAENKKFHTTLLSEIRDRFRPQIKALPKQDPVLNQSKDSIPAIKDTIIKFSDQELMAIFAKDSLSFYRAYDSLDKAQKSFIRTRVKMTCRHTLSDFEILGDRGSQDTEFIRRHYIEIYRKFTLSFACLILFFIGAPLGAIIRKGGLGMPVVVSALSFVIYYVIGMIGEKAAIEGAVSTFWGMWSSAIVFIPIGLFLTIKATSDSSLLDLEEWKKTLEVFINKILRRKDK